MATRRERRTMGKREAHRRAKALVDRCLELSEKGHDRAFIAKSTGLSPETVLSVLQRNSGARGGDM